MIKTNIHLNFIIVVFGMFVSLAMLTVIRRHQYNQSKGDSLHLIGMTTHPRRGHP
jgi:hypothetical protein